MNAKILALVLSYFDDFEFGIADLAAGARGRVWTRPGRENILRYLGAMNAEGRHIFMRPTEAREPFYALHDDANAGAILRYHGFDSSRRPAHAFNGRLIIETSPENFQAWVRFAGPTSVEEKRRWLDSVGSDPGAAPRRRWGRAPGWRNVKPRHRRVDGTYPVARLIWINAQAIEDIRAEQLHPAPAPRPRRLEFRHLPAPTLADRGRFDKKDDSRTDICWCMSLIVRGYDRAAVRAALVQAREAIGWHSHQPEDYVDRTIQRALEFLGRG